MCTKPKQCLDFPDEGFSFFFSIHCHHDFAPIPTLAPAVTVLPSAHLWCAHNPQSSSRVRFFFFCSRKHRRGSSTHKNMVRTSALPPLDCYPHVWMRRQCSWFSCCDNGSLPSEDANALMSWQAFGVFLRFFFLMLVHLFFWESNSNRSKLACLLHHLGKSKLPVFHLCVQISCNYSKNIKVSSADVMRCQAKLELIGGSIITA